MLTEHRIREAKPGAKPQFLWDEKIKGLGVKLNPKGASVYVLQYRIAGKSRRITLGRTAEMSLKYARHRAAADLVAVRDGRDPAEERRKEANSVANAPTVADLWATFETEYAPTRIANGRMTAGTVRFYERYATRYLLPAIGVMPVADVTRGDITAVVARVSGRAQYNRCLAIISRLFTLAEHLEYRPQGTNPARGIERAREEPRDRTLNPSELAALASALDASNGNPAGVAAIRVAALTGLRIGEVLAMRWEDVDFESRRLTMPTTKTGRRVHDLPAPALAVLADQPRIDGNPWVFATEAGVQSYDATQRLFMKIVKAAGLKDVRLHDLRRTVMTNAAMAGVGTHILRDLLGHKTTQMADRYVRNVGSPVRDAREQVSEAMAAMMEGKSGDVVPMRNAR